MGDTDNLSFPYEFKKITPEEQEYVNKTFGNHFLPLSMRIGPKGYILYEPYKIDAANIYNMPLRPTDVFVSSFQRSGTTWTQELVWLLANDLDYTKAAAVPLARRYPFLDIFMFFDSNHLDEQLKNINSHLDDKKVREVLITMGRPVTGTLAKMPESEPRFIKTHLPMSLLNPKLLDTAKMVYVARDPRDVAVSCYHHARLFKTSDFQGNFKEFWNMFYKGLYFFCPIFEHVKEAWDLRYHPNMLFLFYEELSKDLPASVRRVADFLGKDLNKEEMDRLCDHLSFENFKSNKSVNYEDIKELGLFAKNENFIRKGQTGSWRDYFDEEMTLQAEHWIADNLRNTDLRYPSVTFPSHHTGVVRGDKENILSSI